VPTAKVILHEGISEKYASAENTSVMDFIVNCQEGQMSYGFYC